MDCSAIETSDKIPVGDMLFFCLPPKDVALGSLQEVLDWYAENPGKCVVVKNAVVNIPPRYGMSNMVPGFFPEWKFK